jgi:hypothetical protein
MSKIKYYIACILGVIHKVLSTTESVISADAAALFELYLEI